MVAWCIGVAFETESCRSRLRLGQPFDQALASFLRLIFGLQPSRHFDASPPPWKDAYDKQYPERPAGHQITILDLSQLASEVLENVTALIGRLILEFMQRNPDRGKFPVVLVLEEPWLTRQL